MTLKPIDLFILAKLTLLNGDSWTIKSIATDLYLNTSEVHGSLRRSSDARLLNLPERLVFRRNLEEFILHGAKYAFPAERGGPTIGLPTCYAAPPLNETIVEKSDIPVWPDPEGPRSGYAFAPLHKSAVCAARSDRQLYELLALIDAIREGRAREVKLATDAISKIVREAK